MFAAGLAASTCKKNEEQVAMSLIGHLLAKFA